MPRILPVVEISSVKGKPPDDSNKERGHAPLEKIEICLNDIPFQLSKPLVVSMSLFGLLFLNSKKSKWCLVTRVYSICILVIFWASAVILFTTYKGMEFGTDSFLKIIVHTWMFHCCVNAMVTYKACHSEQRFVKFLLEWSNLLMTNRGISVDHPCAGLKKYKWWAKRKFTFLLTVAWLMVIINCVSNSYFLFETDLLHFTIAPLSPTHPLAIWVKVLVNLAQIYRSATWIFSICLFLMMAGVIYQEFEVLHMELRKAISPEGDIVGLESFRRRHQEICQMVETADDILSAFNACGILLPAFDAMFMLYSLVYNTSVTSDPLLFAAHCFWLSGTLGYLFFISFGGGYLNHMAHAPLKTIHSIKVRDASVEFSLQMNMFLNKLSGESIGLTVLDMFVIDKPTILTIAGAFVTYFIVLIQFQQPAASSTTTFVCNCTDILLNSTLQCSAL